MSHQPPTQPAAEAPAPADPARRTQTEEELERRVRERTRQLETQSRELEAALRQAKAAATAAQRAKSEFLADVSHDFRTPMNAILGYAQLLRRETTLPETVRDQIEIIERNGQKLMTLLDSILKTAPASPRMRRRGKQLKATAPAYRILVVDDQADNRNLMLKLLRLTGFEAEAVANGLEALAAFDRWQPHLVVMDTQMPEMNGLEAIRRLRALPNGGALKIISLSAAVFPEDRREALSSGADEFVSKPVEVEELLEKIGELLRLEYEYQATAAGDGQGNTPSSASLLPPDLGTLPSGLREQLHAAVVEADFDEVHRLIQHVKSLDASLARCLGKLASDFDAEQLLRLLAAAPKSNPA